MKRFFVLVISITGWFAVIAQLVLMYINRTTPVQEMIIRFFSFFTILTNILVSVYFTSLLLTATNSGGKNLTRTGSLTAVTVYITVVGLVYQVALRHIWHPEGIQMIVDELLHSIIPTMVILFWLFHERKRELNWKSIPAFLIYPLCYLAFILLRGSISGFYPYPFINVTELGWPETISNILILFGVFVILFFLFIGLGKLISKNKT